MFFAEVTFLMRKGRMYSDHTMKWPTFLPHPALLGAILLIEAVIALVGWVLYKAGAFVTLG